MNSLTNQYFWQTIYYDTISKSLVDQSINSKWSDIYSILLLFFILTHKLLRSDKSSVKSPS